jgi:hypothetical protein
MKTSGLPPWISASHGLLAYVEWIRHLLWGVRRISGHWAGSWTVSSNGGR